MEKHGVGKSVPKRHELISFFLWDFDSDNEERLNHRGKYSCDLDKDRMEDCVISEANTNHNDTENELHVSIDEIKSKRKIWI